MLNEDDNRVLEAGNDVVGPTLELQRGQTKDCPRTRYDAHLGERWALIT